MHFQSLHNEGKSVLGINESINQSCISVRQDRCMFQYHCKGLYLSNWRNVLTEDVIFCTCAFYIHFLLSSVKFLVTVARDVL